MAPRPAQAVIPPQVTRSAGSVLLYQALTRSPNRRTLRGQQLEIVSGGWVPLSRDPFLAVRAMAAAIQSALRPIRIIRGRGDADGD